MGLPDVYLMPHQNDPAPTRYWEAIYSAAWAAAMVVHRVPPGPAWFTEERINDPDCRATAAKVHISEHAPATAAFQTLDMNMEGWVEIDTGTTTLKGKKSMLETYGGSANPMPVAMFNDKFRNVVAPSLGETAATELRLALESIASLDDVRQLQPLLAGSGAN